MPIKSAKYADNLNDGAMVVSKRIEELYKEKIRNKKHSQ